VGPFVQPGSPGDDAMTLFCLHDARHGIAIQEICLLDKIVEFAPLPDKFGWSIKFRYRTTIQNHYAIGVNDGVDSVCNSDDSAILEDAAAQCLLEKGIGFDINGGL
jgi:hypothetical protein